MNLYKKKGDVLIISDEFSGKQDVVSIGEMVEVIVDRRNGAEKAIGELIGIRCGHINLRIGQDNKSYYYKDIMQLRKHEELMVK